MQDSLDDLVAETKSTGIEALAVHADVLVYREVVGCHLSRFTFLIRTPSTTKVDVENCRFVLLTRRQTSSILWLLRSYWFARKAGGTEGQTVRKDCLAFLFLPIFRSAPPSLPALLFLRRCRFSSGKHYLPAAAPPCRALLSTGPPRNGWAICRLSVW